MSEDMINLLQAAHALLDLKGVPEKGRTLVVACKSCGASVFVTEGNNTCSYCGKVWKIALAPTETHNV